MQGSAAPPHSEEWIDDSRLSWWSTEHLASILKRHNIKERNKILDVGVGQGHWAATLTATLGYSQDITGVDFELAWVERSKLFFAERYPDSSYHAFVSNGDKLPFADETFDIATCQTVLMHCRDAQAVLREMRRVTRQDGFIILSEPMNHWNRIGVQLLLAGESKAAEMGWKIWSAFRQQRIREGLGDNDIAATLPSQIEMIGLKLRGSYQTEYVTIEDIVSIGAEAYLGEYNKPENIDLLERAGVKRADISEARDELAKVLEKMMKSKTTKLASPMPLLLFICQKL